MLFHWRPKNAFSWLLRIVSKTYQWTWKHLPLMLRSTELNTFAMTNMTSLLNCEHHCSFIDLVIIFKNYGNSAMTPYSSQELAGMA